MKTRWRPFIKHVQQLPQTIYNRLLTRPLPPSNPLWEQTQAEARAWKPVLTLEQEEEDASWLNSEVEVCILQKLPTTSSERIWAHLHDQTHDIAKLTTLEMPAFTTNQQFKRTVTTTGEITSSLRRVNTTDPFLPSTRMTPNHEFAIVPRRTAPLPLNEHKLSVEQLINAAIVDFHLKHHRLPHKITIAAIRYLRYRISIDTYDPNIFYYDNIPIPITSAPIGDFGIDEVWLD